MSYLVKNYMRKDVYTIDSESTALEASKNMLEKNSGYLIVLEKNKPVGVVTERDLVFKVMALGKDPSKIKVKEIMSQPIVTIDPDATLDEAVDLMVKYDLRRIPVVRGGIIYGIFTTRDLAKHFKEYEEKILRDIIRIISRFSVPF
ncbi:MAG: CBS domain-containing protein [Candidatus Methanomethylicia archaeon]|nr:CBS domain-containing protein [Candidatus Methanomethylicia archaeon]MCX8168894.1 CBS domain-containing protein [Candidatus Methanomethylicia archaeon]MDW7988626.1 CBS domain-containing protein [Nitrososphaerota archaeon]